MINLDRGLLRIADVSASREWLVTNGIGGYASGTVAGHLTRRYHGYLVAALKPPLARTMLVPKVDEIVGYDGRDFILYANSWAANSIYTKGFLYLDRFELEGTIPVWTYALGDALLQKRIWMEHGENTTYVRYDLVRAREPVQLQLKSIVNYRGFHSVTRADGWQPQFSEVTAGFCVGADSQATPYYLLCRDAELTLEPNWYRNYYLSVEAYRGEDAVEDHYYAGYFRATVAPGRSLTLVLSTAAAADLDGVAAYQRRRRREQRLIKQANVDPQVEHLVLAADQFIVERPTDHDSDGRSIIAGYHWFSDWGRDTMISLPGLTLTTGRSDAAASILRTYARFVDQGMIPNRFPDEQDEPEYNTVDATLWYFEALRAYWSQTGDNELLGELYPTLQEIIDWHKRGTRYNIHMDQEDALLYAGQSGVQLTWMDAKIEDWVVTPRIGKPIEVNALWYNALCAMADFARALDEDATPYMQLAERVCSGFQKFWDARRQYCHDVIGGPGGGEEQMRPNQLFAVSLPYSPLEPAQQQAVVEACMRGLLTPHGLRSLARNEPGYQPAYGGNRRQRDAAYHQGTVWSWLIGPFVAAHLRVYNDPDLARTFLAPLLNQLGDHGIGSISEIFDATAPYTPRGCIAQAWGVAELLRGWHITTQPSLRQRQTQAAQSNKKTARERA